MKVSLLKNEMHQSLVQLLQGPWNFIEVSIQPAIQLFTLQFVLIIDDFQRRLPRILWILLRTSHKLAAIFFWVQPDVTWLLFSFQLPHRKCEWEMENEKKREWRCRLDHHTVTSLYSLCRTDCRSLPLPSPSFLCCFCPTGKIRGRGQSFPALNTSSRA